MFVPYIRNVEMLITCSTVIRGQNDMISDLMIRGKYWLDNKVNGQTTLTLQYLPFSKNNFHPPRSAKNKQKDGTTDPPKWKNKNRRSEGKVKCEK